jgi:hypothetical protein
MSISHLVTLAATLSTLSVALSPLPAAAEPVGHADQLLPLENRILVIKMNPNLFSTAAQEINTFQERQDGSEDSGLLNMGFLEGLVDENGEVDLPLGITVFDAMGATSVGFGSEF